MNRDLTCLLRLLVDSWPSGIRNSRALFTLAKYLFNLPDSLYTFRASYRNGEISNLRELYDPHNDACLERVSKATDINSMHLGLIKKYFQRDRPDSFLDVGCGSGYLIRELSLYDSSTRFFGLDYCPPVAKEFEHVSFIKGDLVASLAFIADKEFDTVTCTHVLEHVPDPASILAELRRITKKRLIIICPLEKEWCWGMNYHINFFPSQEKFLELMQKDCKCHNKLKRQQITYEFLGDIMCVETN